MPRWGRAGVAAEESRGSRLGAFRDRVGGVRVGFGTDLMGVLEDEQLAGLRLQAKVDEPPGALRSAPSVNADLLARPDLGRYAKAASPTRSSWTATRSRTRPCCGPGRTDAPSSGMAKCAEAPPSRPAQAKGRNERSAQRDRAVDQPLISRRVDRPHLRTDLRDAGAAAAAHQRRISSG